MKSISFAQMLVCGRSTSRRNVTRALTMTSLVSLGACSDAVEANRVDLPVVVDGSADSIVTTDLGYQVELTSARIALRDIVFTIAGEADNGSAFHRVSGFLISTAHAHPGHFQAGDVTGELPGRFVADWAAEDKQFLGLATLITGTYTAANFVFDRGSEEAGLASDDSLVGHTAWLAGRAEREGVAVNFTIIVDSPDGRELVGAPFEFAVREEAAGELALRFEPLDSIERDTVFDGIDFAGLDCDGDGRISIQPGVPAVEADYDLFRRTFQTHDHFSVRHQEVTL